MSLLYQIRVFVEPFSRCLRKFLFGRWNASPRDEAMVSLASNLSNEKKGPLVVLFCLVLPYFGDLTYLANG